MLARFFNSSKKLRDTNPEVRAAYLQRLTPDKAGTLQAELHEAFRAEEVTNNRLLILPLLTDLTLLADILDTEQATPLAQFLADHPDKTPASLATHPRVIRAKLVSLTDPAQQQDLINSIDSTELLLDLARTCKGTAQDAVLAHANLRSADALHALEVASRNHDKRVNRHARDRLAQIKSAQEAHASALAEIQRVVQTTNRVTQQPQETPSAKEATRTHLIALKRQYATALEELEESKTALAACHLECPSEMPDDPFKELDLAPPKESPFSQVLESLPQVGATANAAQLATDLANAEEQWQSLCKLQTPESSLATQFVANTEALQQWLAAMQRIEDAQWSEPPALPDTLKTDGVWQQVKRAENWLKQSSKLSQSIAWPRGVEQPSQLTAQDNKRDALKAQIDALHGQSAKLAEQAQQCMQSAEAAIDAGESKAAQGQLAQARDLIARLPSKVDFDKPMKQLYARIGELRDWQTFATSPKREALVESMEALVGINKEPEALSDAIKALREEWNALGRPANRHEHKLLETFNDAAERAFEPCRAHFAALGEERANNLEKRRALADQLEQYIKTNDWAQADYEAAEKIMRTAREEWWSYFPVPRGKGKDVTKQFEALQSQLHDLLQQHWQRNIDTKQQLIIRAKQLQADAPLAEQIDGVKSLQAEWKRVGSIPRHQDQKLWSEFREVCDAIFNARTQANTERDEAYAARREAAALLNQQFEASLSGELSKKALEDYRASFIDVGDLGRDGKQLITAHRDLCNRHEELMNQASKQRKVQRLLDIEAEDERLCAAEDSGSAVESEVAEFSKRKEQAEPLSVLEELTIKAEIAADMPSPSHASPRRMEIQVAMMNQGGGNAALPSREALLRTWCEVGGKGTSDEVAELRKRFFAAVTNAH